MAKYRKLLSPNALIDFWINAAVALLLVAVALALVIWILSRIWLWLLGIGVVVGSAWLLLRIVRWRRDQW